MCASGQYADSRMGQCSYAGNIAGLNSSVDYQYHINITHLSGSSRQFVGRLMPGCGHAGQNRARSPFPGDLSVSCP